MKKVNIKDIIYAAEQYVMDLDENERESELFTHLNVDGLSLYVKMIVFWDRVDNSFSHAFGLEKQIDWIPALEELELIDESFDFSIDLTPFL